MERYPTRAELKKVAGWDLLDPHGLIEYLRARWWMPNWGFKLSGKRVIRLALHTGGWSGNEDLVEALERSLFWTLYWRRSDRGGHYYFTVRRFGKNSP